MILNYGKISSEIHFLGICYNDRFEQLALLKISHYAFEPMILT